MSTRTRIVRKHGAKSTVGASGSTTAARRTSTPTTPATKPNKKKRVSSAGTRKVKSQQILEPDHRFLTDYLLVFNQLNYPNIIFRVNADQKYRLAENPNQFRLIEITNHPARLITMDSVVKFYKKNETKGNTGVPGEKHFLATKRWVDTKQKRVIDPVGGLTHHLNEIAQKRESNYRGNKCLFTSDEEQPRVQWITRVQQYLTGTMTPHEYAATVRDLMWTGQEFEISAPATGPLTSLVAMPLALSLLHHSSVNSESSSNFTDDWDQPNRSFNSSSSSSSAASSSSSSVPSSPVYAGPSRTSSTSSSVSASFKLSPQLMNTSDLHLQLPLSVNQSVLMDDDKENEEDTDSIVVKQEPIEEEQPQRAVASMQPIVKIEPHAMMMMMTSEDDSASVATAAEEENAEFRTLKEESKQEVLQNFDVDSFLNFDEDLAEVIMKQEQKEEDPAMMKTAALLSSSSLMYNLSETPMPNLMYAMPSTEGGARMYRDMSSPQSLQHPYSQQSYYHTPHSPFHSSLIHTSENASVW